MGNAIAGTLVMKADVLRWYKASCSIAYIGS